MPKAKLISITPDYMNLLKIACSKPYGNNVSDNGIQSIIESGHLSILEHCYASFDVECSVRVLGQLTRHRHLSFTVKSSRGSEFNRVECPTKLASAYGVLLDAPMQEAYDESALNIYNEMLSKGVPLEDAAYLLPQGVLTSMVITGNFRAWYEYLPKRLCARAMAEHQELAKQILNILSESAPEIFGNNSFMNCENCKEKSCDFK